MSENTNVNTQEQEIKVQENKNGVSLEHILSEIKAIREQTSHLNEALKMLDSVDQFGPGDIGAAEKSKAIADVVRCRETTNQQILKFYEKLYDDMKSAREVSEKERQEFLKFVKDTTVGTAGAATEYTPGNLPDFDKIWTRVFLQK